MQAVATKSKSSDLSQQAHAEKNVSKKQNETFLEKNSAAINTNAFGIKHDFSKLNINSPVIQPKLTINQPNDIYEQEADAVANKIMRMPAENLSVINNRQNNIQRKCKECEEEEKGLQRKEANGAIPLTTISVHQTLESHGKPMDKGTQQYMNKRFGYDFSKVQIHNDSIADTSANDINALAYTYGNNIVFRQGQYQPQTNTGKHLLAHELTHVLQQTKNTERKIQRKGSTIGGFFSNLGRSIASIFTDEPGFDNDTLKKYLAVLDAGEIEDDFNSDDKARIVVREWMKNPQKMPLTQQRKLMLIKEMLSGATLNDDEHAILNILQNSPGNEVDFLVKTVTPEVLLNKINGNEHNTLQVILADLCKRKVLPQPASKKTIWINIGFDSSVKTDDAVTIKKLDASVNKIKSSVESCCCVHNTACGVTVMPNYNFKTDDKPAPSDGDYDSDDSKDMQLKDKNLAAIKTPNGGLKLLVTKSTLSQTWEGQRIFPRANTSDKGVLFNPNLAADDTAAHEAGHAAGYKGNIETNAHNSDKHNLMSPGSIREADATPDDNWCEQIAKTAV